MSIRGCRRSADAESVGGDVGGVGRHEAAEGVAGEGDPVGVVDQPVEDRIAQRGVPDAPKRIAPVRAAPRASVAYGHREGAREVGVLEGRRHALDLASGGALLCRHAAPGRDDVRHRPRHRACLGTTQVELRR